MKNAKIIAFDAKHFEYDLINLTPHSIFMNTKRGGSIYEVKPSGIVTRVSKQVTNHIYSIRNKVCPGEDIKVASIKAGHIIDLPDPKQGTLYIVSGLTSRIISEQLPYRNDILSVDSKHLRKMRSAGELPTVFRLLSYERGV